MSENKIEINTKYLLKQTFWVYLFTYLAAPIGYLIRVLYARSFSIEEFGLIYAVMGIITLISTFNDLGFTETMYYYTTRFYEKKQYKKVKGSLLYAFWMQTGTAILLALAFFFLSPWLAEHYFKTGIALSTFRWFLLYLILYNASKPFTVLFGTTQKHSHIRLSELVKNVIMLILSGLILFLPTFKNTNYIGLAWGIGMGLTFLLFYMIARKKYPLVFNTKADMSFRLYKKLWRYATYVLFGVAASFLVTRIDIALITYYLNVEAVGYYSVALSLATIMFTLAAPLISMIFPLTSKFNVNKNKKKIINLIKVIYTKGLYLMLPLLLIFLSYPNEILRLIFGKNFIVANKSLMILAIGYFINVFYVFNVSITAGLGFIKERTKILYIGATFNVIGNIILIPILGIAGAAISTTLCILLMFVLSIKLLNKNVKFALNRKDILKILIINIVTFIVITLMKTLIKTNIFLEAGIILIVVGGLYLFVGKYFKILNIKEILLSITKKD